MGVALRDLRQVDALEEVDRRLVGLCRQRGPLRAVLARIAARLVEASVWERIGYARLSDFAAECLGLSARSVRSLAQVGARLRRAPVLEDALVSGILGWTKVRLVGALPCDEDLGCWIAYARSVSAAQLSTVVRAVDRGSVEAGAAEDGEARSRVFEVRCTPVTLSKWRAARSAAAREAGRTLHASEAAELIAAEVLSAVPLDEEPDGACGEEGSSLTRAAEREEVASVSSPDERGAVVPSPPWRGQPGAAVVSFTRADLPTELRPLVDGLEDADAFEVHERFLRAHALERRLDAQVGPLLAPVWVRWVHRALGYTTREAYARERLGMDATRARTLVRLERVAAQSEPFARAYRSGSLSSVKASVLEPIVRADSLGRFVGKWVAWAGRVTVRRLREDVERAVDLSEADREAFGRDGGLPPEARCEREIGAGPTFAGGYSGSRGRGIGAASTHAEGSPTDDQREIGAQPTFAGGYPAGFEAADGAPWSGRERGPTRSAPEERCWARFFGPADVVQLFKAVLNTVRRRMEREDGGLPTPGEALGAMLDHALSSWGASARVAARHRVFARDGWRCAAPGCSSMDNLHDHHIRFRSAGGSDAPENRVTLCAFHHLRGVHAGLMRCVGRAPDGIRWELGLRPGVSPLLAYRSGDVRVAV